MAIANLANIKIHIKATMDTADDAIIGKADALAVVGTIDIIKA